MRENTCIVCGRIIPEGRHICLACGDYDDQQRFCPPKHARQTNGDRIRAMSDAELAQYLESTERRALFTDGVTSAWDWQKWLESEANCT